MHVAHPNKCTKEIFRADVVADFARRDRSVQQSSDRPRQPIERICEKFRVFVRSKRKRCRHSLFRGNEPYIRAHPLPQRLDRLRLLFQLFGQIGKLLHFATVHRFEQGFARGEMPVEGADADPGSSGYGFEARLRTPGTENRFGGLKHALAVPNRVGARLSRPIFQLHHADSPNLNKGACKAEGASVSLWSRHADI